VEDVGRFSSIEKSSFSERSRTYWEGMSLSAPGGQIIDKEWNRSGVAGREVLHHGDCGERKEKRR